jgi:hypothetical protein
MLLADGKNKLATWMDTHTGIVTQYFKTGNIYQTQEPWNFVNYEANTVVINLGQNDTSEITNEFFTQAYVAMMEKIRQNYANTVILALRPFSGNRMGATRDSVKACNEVGDNKLYFIDTTAGWHANIPTTAPIPQKRGTRKSPIYWHKSSTDNSTASRRSEPSAWNRRQIGRRNFRGQLRSMAFCQGQESPASA